MRRTVVLLAALAALAPSAHAQSFVGPTDDLVVTVGGGGRVAPEWDGSSRYVLSPMPIFGLKFLRSPFTGKPSTDEGFGVAPSIRLISKRHFDAASPLAGLPDVATAFEAGLTVDYTAPWFRAFVTARQGFGGHRGQVFDLGVDGIVRPNTAVTLTVGPRLSFATSDYTRAYFGVTAADALATGLPAHDPSGGLRSWGLAAGATWDIDERWFVRADASWQRLADDLARSPIVEKAGSRDQFSVGLGVGWRFATGWH